MIKVSVFLRRRPDLTHEQFSHYWKEKHAPLVMSLDVGCLQNACTALRPTALLEQRAVRFSSYAL
jgi:hypothetical protein